MLHKFCYYKVIISHFLLQGQKMPEGRGSIYLTENPYTSKYVNSWGFLFVGFFPPFSLEHI